MTPFQARHMEKLARLCGMAGVAAPADPAQPQGEWRLYDRAEPATRRDVTAEVRRQVSAGPVPALPLAGRGFLVPGSTSRR
ncbi:hypothetical protein GL263_22595 [Streptomyces durbertensis]|uniref:Uncharacterized protein n=1 Tax=Streptomyces durbertensis TaxID=2448886 RepID=A0ABR6EM53_9ACTN|nr:hypothetical protein [Streptomyces durbertensis]MBB1246323.1 hypothetical protein [Streptomyces durbertensis]